MPLPPSNATPQPYANLFHATTVLLHILTLRHAGMRRTHYYNSLTPQKCDSYATHEALQQAVTGDAEKYHRAPRPQGSALQHKCTSIDQAMDPRQYSCNE